MLHGKVEAWNFTVTTGERISRKTVYFTKAVHFSFSLLNDRLMMFRDVSTSFYSTFSSVLSLRRFYVHNVKVSLFNVLEESLRIV